MTLGSGLSPPGQIDSIANAEEHSWMIVAIKKKMRANSFIECWVKFRTRAAGNLGDVAGVGVGSFLLDHPDVAEVDRVPVALQVEDRKSTRLNSSHSQISYAVFCLK